MEQDNKPVALNTADARHLINQWSAQGFFRVRGLGGKIAVEEILPCSSYTICLRSQYEDRSVSVRTVPFTGGPIDDRGPRPDPWDLPVAQPTDFQDRTEAMALPHTDRVRTCPLCGSRGRVTCGTCSGFGKVTCPQCGGAGFRTRTETRSVPDANGNPVLQTVEVRDNCTCFNGKVGCNPCHGQGTVVCGDCQGHGRVKTFDELSVQFRVDSLTEVLHATKIPDALLKRARGEVLVESRAAPAVQCPRVVHHVDERVAQLLKLSQSQSQEKTRLLFQHLHIESVAVQEVQYRYRNSPVKYLWIYGKEQHIHAPGVPRPWARWAAIGLGFVLVVAAVVVALAALH
jgi:hypothetical protein